MKHYRSLFFIIIINYSPAGRLGREREREKESRAFYLLALRESSKGTHVTQYLLSLVRSSDKENLFGHLFLSVRSLDGLCNRGTTKYCPC